MSSKDNIMTKTDPEELRIRLRKHQSNLTVIGLGVIAFGVWTLIKGVLYTALDTDMNPRNFTEDTLEFVLYWFFFEALLLIELAIRTYIGRSAISEGRSGKKKNGYIVLALFLAALSFVGCVSGLFVGEHTQSPGNTLVTFIVEMTSDALLVDMCISAIQVRRLGRRIAEAER